MKNELNRNEVAELLDINIFQIEDQVWDVHLDSWLTVIRINEKLKTYSDQSTAALTEQNRVLRERIKELEERAELISKMRE